MRPVMPTPFTAAQIATAIGWDSKRVAGILRGYPFSAQLPVDGHLVKAWTLYSIPANLKVAVDQAALAKGYTDTEAYMFAAPLPDRARPVADPDLVPLFTPLGPHIAAVLDREKPTLADRSFLLDEACRLLDGLMQDPCNVVERAKIRRGLEAYILTGVPGLSTTAKGMKNMLSRAFKKWNAGGRSASAVADQRKGHSGRPGYRCEPCEKKIHDLAIHARGNEAYAFRQLLMRGLLCKKCMDHHGPRFNIRRNKSRVPKALRDRITPNPLTTVFLHGGTREAMIAGPHPVRDYSDIHAGDFYTADDMTGNERVIAGKNEKGGYDLWRPQLVIMSDVATAKALDFVTCFGHPTSRLVQRLQFQVYASEAGVGMPRRGQNFERGVFASLLVAATAHKDAYDARELVAWFSSRFAFCGEEGEGPAAIYQAWRERLPNLKILHHRLPMAKPIECEIGIVQRHAAAQLPVHIGFNERLEKRTVVSDFIARCEAGKEDPRSEGILTLEEYAAQWKRILEEYNNEPQNGRRLRGQSPNEAWAAYVADHPLEKLPKELWYLLSTHHKRDVLVQKTGIVIPKGLVDPYEPSIYYGHPRLGELVRRRVDVYINVDFPEFITVRSGQEFFMVKRQKYLSNTASQDDLKEMNRAKWNHMRPAQILAGNVEHPLAFTVERESDFPEAQREMGAEINRMRSEVIAEREAAADKDGQLRRRAAKAGLAIDRGLDLSNGKVRQGVELQIRAAERRQALKTEMEGV